MQPDVTPPVDPNQTPKPPRPPQKTPVSVPTIQERPVTSWAPANEALKATKKTAPTLQEAESIGLETAQAAGAIPVDSQTPGSPKMNDFITPTQPTQPLEEPAKIPDPALQAPMNDAQADQLFKSDEPQKKSHKGLRKLLLTLIVLLVLGGVSLAGYVFFFSSKAAQSYQNSSGLTAYKDSLTQIKTALEADPTSLAELESGLNKLKTTTENSKRLNEVVLGNLNPNYKKAQQASLLEAEFSNKLTQFQSTYGDYPEFIASALQANKIASEIGDIANTDLTTTTAEDLSQKVKDLVEECKITTKSLNSATKPADMGEDAQKFSLAISNLCQTAPGSLEAGLLVLLEGKTGVLAEADRAVVKAQMQAITTNLSLISSGSHPDSLSLNKVGAYGASSLQDVSALLQEVEAILNG